MFRRERIIFGIIGLIIVGMGFYLIIGFATLVDVEIKGGDKQIEVNVKNAPAGIVCVIMGCIIILAAIFAPHAKVEMEYKGSKIKVPIKVLRQAEAGKDETGAYHVDIRDDPEIRKALKDIEGKT